jgi:hypothetical protein
MVALSSTARSPWAAAGPMSCRPPSPRCTPRCRATGRRSRRCTKRPGAPNGAAEHPHLVAEHGVLEPEVRHAPTSGVPSDEANQDEVGEGPQGARDATDRR